MFKCVDKKIDSMSLFQIIIVMSFIFPLCLFGVFTYCFKFDVVNSLIAISTLSMAFTALFTVLFMSKKLEANKHGQ